MTGIRNQGWLLLMACLFMNFNASGQVDPDYRELVEAGFNQELEGAAPLYGYGFYYLNEPNFFETNATLRLALAPVYVDTETGFVHLLGPNTDFGLGLAGGGYADNYYEFHKGQYLHTQSFIGDSVESSASIYHLFNPGALIPLNGLFRIKEHYSIYSRDETSGDFILPENHSAVSWRTGLRWGGREPLLHPELAMEISAWYEGQYRTGSGSYGYDGDRALNADSELFWARALLVYTFTNSRQSFEVSLTAGGSADVDRFSAYRLGGNLPMAAEFPLIIPGYFAGELSARDFTCFNAQYTFPLDPSKRWSLNPMGTVADVDYAPEMAQPGHFNSGVGMGLGYRSRSKAWRAVVDYGYGFEAIRSGGRGGQSVGFLMEIDLGVRHPNGPSKLDDVAGYLREHL